MNLKGLSSEEFLSNLLCCKGLPRQGSKKVDFTGVTPNSFIKPLPCRTKLIYCIQDKNNKMYLVQQGSGLATAQHINWVLNHFLAKILQFAGWKSDKPLQLSSLEAM